MKTITIIIIIIFINFIIIFPTSALAEFKGSLSLDPSSGTFNKGCPLTVNILLDTNGAQTDGTDAILSYDSSRLSIDTQSIFQNTAVYPDFPGNNVDESAGKITISGLASVSTPFSGKGILATVNFTVKAAAPTGVTQVKFDFDPRDKGKTTDSNIVERNSIADVLNSVVNGSYTIGTGACVSPVPTVTPQKGTGGQGQGGQVATGSGQKKTIDDAVGGKTGTQELTFTLAIVGSVLTVLGILGLALL